MIGAYGNCATLPKPVIKASYWINPNVWAVESSDNPTGRIMSTVYSNGNTVLADFKRLFQSNIPLTKARYPDTDATGKPKFALASSLGTSNTFKATGDDLTALQQAAQSGDVVGAVVYVRTLPYMVERAVVSAFNSSTGTVTLSQNLTNPIKEGAGYILEGKRWMLSKDGEWFLDAAQAPKKLYYWAPRVGSTPNVTDIEATNANFGVQAYNTKGLHVEWIRFEQQEQASIQIDGSNIADGVVISDVESVHAGSFGIVSSKTPGVIIKNNRVEGAGYFGINANESVNASVSGNYVVGTGLNNVGHEVRESGVDSWKGVGGNAIRLDGAGAVAENNFVYRSAYIGIFFKNNANTLVRGNTVALPCLRLTDCAGIYTRGWPLNSSGPLRGEVSANIVVGVSSNLDGSHIFGDGSQAGKNQAYGIYLDDESARVKVTGNTISNAEGGIFIHNGASNEITDNLVRDVTHASLIVATGKVSDAAGIPNGANVDYVRGNVIAHNDFFSQRKVDTAWLTDASSTGAKSLDGDSVYAELWQNGAQSPAAFFADNASGQRNRSENNSVYTVSNVNANTWRLNNNGQMTRVDGAVWGLITDDGPVQILGLSQWLATASAGALSSTFDGEISPVAFKPFSVNSGSNLIQNGAFDQAGSWHGVWGTANGSFSFTSCSGSPCGRLVAGADSDYLASNAFTLSGQATPSSYLLSYDVSGGSNGGVHRTLVRDNAGAGPGVALTITQTALAANETKTVQQFFRPAVPYTNAALALLATDGSLGVGKDIYFKNVKLVPVTSVDVLPALNTMGIHVLNASATKRILSCADLSITAGNCSTMVLEGNGAISSIEVEPGSALKAYFRKAAWVAN